MDLERSSDSYSSSSTAPTDDLPPPPSDAAGATSSELSELRHQLSQRDAELAALRQSLDIEKREHQLTTSKLSRMLQKNRGLAAGPSDEELQRLRATIAVQQRQHLQAEEQRVQLQRALDESEARCAEIRRIAQAEVARGGGHSAELAVSVAPPPPARPRVAAPQPRVAAMPSRQITPPESAAPIKRPMHAEPRVAGKAAPAAATAKRPLDINAAPSVAPSVRPAVAAPPTSSAFAGALPSSYAQGAICVQPPAKRPRAAT